MSHRVVTVGELTLDDLIYEDGECHWKQPGGGALYSAIGCLVWGARPAISAVVGADYPAGLLERLEEAGIDTSPIDRIEANSLGLWLLYEHSGRRHQVEKESGSPFTALDEARSPLTSLAVSPDGIHIAPQTTKGQMRALSEATKFDVLVTQDLLIEPFVSTEPYRDATALKGADAFLPSDQEVRQLWGDIDTTDLLNLVRDRAGVEILVVKRGEEGAEVVSHAGSVVIPSAVEDPVDPTGAGDAFCGGFLVGLLDTNDPIEAAVRGAVSASFVVETRNAVEALRVVDPDHAHRKAARCRQRMKGAT